MAGQAVSQGLFLESFDMVHLPSFSRVACSLAVALFVLGSSFATAGDSESSPRSAQPARDLLAAEAEGLVAVRYVPQDSRSAQVVVSNPGSVPLTLKMPQAFVGVPVLAQFGGGMGGMGGGMGGMGGGMGGMGMGGAQATGGGMGGMGGMGGGMGGMGGMGMGGGGFCWVAREVYGAHDPRWVEFRDWLAGDAPVWLHDLYRDHGEAFAAWIHDRPTAKLVVRTLMDNAIADRDRGSSGVALWQVRDRASPAEPGSFVVYPGQTRRFRFATVCLEHGKPEPSPRMTYRMQALDAFSTDPRLDVVMAALGSGTVSQKVAQAAAWHIANDLSWQRLKAETIHHVGGRPDEPFFQPGELATAMRLVKYAEDHAVSQAAAASVTGP
jgi:hypothetical protein